MTKLKKTYCILSLIFAIAVFVAVLFASQNRTTVYAASMDPDSIDSLDIQQRIPAQVQVVSQTAKVVCPSR